MYVTFHRNNDPSYQPSIVPTAPSIAAIPSVLSPRLTSLSGWKMSPSGSWPSERQNLSLSRLLVCAGSQKSLARIENGSEVLSSRPASMAEWRASMISFCGVEGEWLGPSPNQTAW